MRGRPKTFEEAGKALDFAILERVLLACARARHGIEGINRALMDRDDTARVLRWFGGRIAPSALVGARPRMHAAAGSYANLVVGAGARIGDDCFLDLTDRIEVRAGAVLGPLVAVITHHAVNRSPLVEFFPSSHEPVVFEEGCEVGAGCVITQGVVVGARARILPGTVISRNIPPDIVIGGAPPKHSPAGG